VAKGLRGLLQRIGALPPERVARLSDLNPGRVLIDGEVTSEDPLTSPIKKVACVAYQYNASCRISTPKGFSRLKLRRVRVWAPTMRLRVEDGEIELVPPKSSVFEGVTEHALLQTKEYDDFKAQEWPATVGKRVRVLGKARRVGEAWVIDVLELLEPEAPAGPA